MGARSPTRKLALEESAIFNNAEFASEVVKRKRLTSFDFANMWFNVTIPISHHTISVLDLKESKGYHWASAAYFLLGNKAHGFPLWKRLQEQINSEKDEILCCKHISDVSLANIFKGKNSVKSTYCDKEGKPFILENWVLIQLPFQPSLLHQWLEVVICKLYWFEEVYTATFYACPIPCEVYPVVFKVYELVLSAHNNIATLFDFLQAQVKSDVEIHVQNPRYISMTLSNIVDFLNFVFDEDKLEGLKLLEKYILDMWDPVSTSKRLYLHRSKMMLRRRSYLHNPFFWMQPGGDLKLFGDSDEINAPLQPVMEDKSVFEHITKENFEERFWKLFVKDTFNCKDYAKYFPKLFDTLIQNANFYTTWKRSLYLIRDEDKGVLTNTFSSLSKARCSFLWAASKQYLCRLLNIKHCDLVNGSKERIELKSQTDLPAMISSLDIVESTWNYETCLEALLKVTGEPTKTCPNVIEESEIIAGKFEARIKKIVLDAISSHYNMTDFEKEKDEVLRDWHVVQYLLPCFVVSYLDLCDSPNPTTKEQKEWYIRFIHELISTYETDGIRRSSESNILDDVAQDPALQESINKQNRDIALVLHFDRISKAFFLKLGMNHDAFDHIKDHCMRFCVLYEVLFGKIKPKMPAGLAEKPCLYWNWLMWDFFNRMDTALKISAPDISIERSVV